MIVLVHGQRLPRLAAGRLVVREAVDAFGEGPAEIHREAGRLGVGLLRDPCAPPFLEHFVSPSRAPVELTLELPHEASIQALVRKTSDEPMRARVTRLMLCDRR